MQPRSWKLFASLAVLSLLTTALPSVAADAAKVDGTWEWSFTTPNGQTFEQKAKLKQDGEKLTGVIIGRNNQETEIKDGKIKDGELSFTVTRERQGQTMTTKYAGKIDGDKIKGKTERERDGQTQSNDWEAKRAKEEK
jgi:hypothetical protein